MNTFFYPTLLLAVMVFSTQSSAQAVIAYNGETAYVTNKPAKSSAPDTDSAFRFHDKLPSLFEGYAIEVAASNYPLDRTQGVFRQFGGIHYDKLEEGGYSYLILCRFNDDKSALNFLRTVVQPRAKEARLIHYKEGNHSIVREDS